jgi:hypothetical protein
MSSKDTQCRTRYYKSCSHKIQCKLQHFHLHHFKIAFQVLTNLYANLSHGGDINITMLNQIPNNFLNFKIIYSYAFHAPPT